MHLIFNYFIYLYLLYLIIYSIYRIQDYDYMIYEYYYLYYIINSEFHIIVNIDFLFIIIYQKIVIFGCKLIQGLEVLFFNCIRCFSNQDLNLFWLFILFINIFYGLQTYLTSLIIIFIYGGLKLF